MWIVSQDGRSIVNMDQVYGIEQQGSSITALLDSHSYKALGYYYTDGKAASVMEQIITTKRGILHRGPQEYKTEYLGSDDVVFRMPHDEDVAV